MGDKKVELSDQALKNVSGGGKLPIDPNDHIAVYNTKIFCPYCFNRFPDNASLDKHLQDGCGIKKL